MNVTRTRYADVSPYTTKDGSQIRELLHPDQHGNRAQSLAEATIAPGQSTLRHRHLRSEEIYHVTAGCGYVVIGDETIELAAGDTVWIPPGTDHWVHNTGSLPMTILCCCAPAYSHDDTLLPSGQYA